MSKIENPILRGFNPDPSIIRIGEDYYIATSTFEWWPGVCIYHSRDLKNWELHSHPLNRASQLDLTGVPDGGGIWAPCLTYDGKTVYLVYTNVRERGPMMQNENYLVTTEDINGEWSEPVYLNSLGFDPSLFHDDDGRKWLISLDNHYRENTRFNGLHIQEYDPVSKKLVGEIKKLYTEPGGELVEGSHLYRHNGMYYLLKAQGGTGPRHSAQLSRSKNMTGPWEDCPFILLHSRDNEDLPFQKAGHADLVDTPDGELYMVHLASRYSCDEKVSIFGRETCIEKVEWTPDGWLRLSGGGANPHTYVEMPKGVKEEPYQKKVRYDFKDGVLSPEFQTLRDPINNRMRFTEKGLCLRGCDGLNSHYGQSLIAKRIESSHMSVTTKVYFEPDWEKHLAGLVFIYDTSHWIYCYISRSNASKSKEINVIVCDNKKMSYPTAPVEINEDVPVEICGKIDGGRLIFSFDDGNGFREIGEVDINILTDEHIYLGFMGTMAGVCCQDLFKKEKCAEFEYIEFKEE